MKLKTLLTVGASVVLSTSVFSSNALAAELAGNITVWHSFTQGPRLEVIQEAANEFMKEHPKVKIKIETFSWNDFYTKWTTGFASGNVPDMSTALPNQVVEMINVGALLPINDLVDKIGRDKFSEAAINEGTVKGKNYSLPLYSHAQVMWIRKDLLKKHNLEVPKTWDELYHAAKVLTKDGVYGLSVPMGTNDFMATRFLNFYVRSGGGSLLTKDLKADLTSPLAQEGIKYWVKMYKETSPKDAINYDVLKQATLYYQGKTAFDFNSGFQIGGVKANSPQLLGEIDAYPMPKINANDPERGIETSNVPLVVWKTSKHPEISKAFIETLYQKDRYIKFLQSVPVGMLPAIKGISDDPAYANNPMVKQFSHAEEVISAAVEKGTAIGYEHGPTVQGGLLTNQHIIEAMFQDIVANGTDPKVAAERAEKQLNELFEMVAP
ncbi:sugar ABC transporter substrate-binding protein [Gallibacterium genomosp. 3]|uniref:Sugar ABC transporter substrate-binding protein n=1 Tax=Gallibacterium genomosp. 3 TaxID=505345 RepID=A0A1A7NV56_9PAST|nr:sugar ABC transporter substrate-binding protein [Gallibacterium genomosp. 3]OBW93578.1 sugar ABC transporter substrate-binding protein [Gallibacterium genomosp. 3]OBX03871.1 sugar ABC transporter substrate-binding protein [Gallibacterium genomosp. 3]